MSNQIQPLRRQMSPDDLTRARILFAKIGIIADLMDYYLTDTKALLDKYKMTHQKRHDMNTVIRMTRALSASNSKSLGYENAVEFGDVCDAIKEGVDKLFKQAQENNG